MNAATENTNLAFAGLDQQLQQLADNRGKWVNTPVAQRIELLAAIKECLMPVAQAWAETAARQKGIAPGSPLVGEEWLSGPYTVLGYCNQMMWTLSQVLGKKHLDSIPLRELPNGQLAARVLPNSIWDRLLLNGITVDVWMQPGVTRANLARNTAGIYDPASSLYKTGKLALVLGAGNIASIAPLDVFQKLFCENQVVMLKMNPVNDYLIEFLAPALKPLTDLGVLAIVRGGTDVGQYLCQHLLVQEIHITGAGASHDAIVWGVGEQARANKAAGTPLNNRTITSELGAVCPTIVVPGLWSDADIDFQAQQVASQKLHNSGFNCVACQVLVVAKGWPQKAAFVNRLEQTMAASEGRGLYYPGAKERLAGFAAHNPLAKSLPRAGAEPVMIAPLDTASDHYSESVEVFSPALSVTELDASDPEAFLRIAITYANERLYGTLGANIVIHPKTIAQIGRARFEEMLVDLRYGTIAINTWTGLGFLTPQAAWGAFPGHTLADVQSGIGFVHNTLMFEKPQRNVVEAPFKTPKPPWFITNRKGTVLGRLLVSFQYRPSWLKLPRIFLSALLG